MIPRLVLCFLFCVVSHGLAFQLGPASDIARHVRRLESPDAEQRCSAAERIGEFGQLAVAAVALGQLSPPVLTLRRALQ